nr:hypothetical protein BaRGS_002167 [Batillaria attramentaria]
MSEVCLSLNVYRPAYNLPAGNTFPGRLVFLPIFNRYDDVIGNFGIRDQEMALRWVQKNIAAFDGDPSKVTLFGAGAGCQSVALHLTSVTAQNLFRSAILQSCPFTLPFRNKNEARRVVKRFASALGCQDNDLDCYRQKSATEILRAQDDAADTARAPAGQTPAPLSGTPKPIMMGFAEEEGRTSVYRDFPLPVSSDFFQQFVQTVFPDKWRQVAETAEAPYRAEHEPRRSVGDDCVLCIREHVIKFFGLNSTLQAGL